MAKKVILTGFRPFGNYQYNPTEDCIRYFNNIGVIMGVKIIGLVLPATYYGAYKELLAVINEVKPDAIISTGLSSEVMGVRFETTFRNLMYSKYCDADGFNPILEKIDKKDTKEFLSSTADNIYLANVLSKAGIHVEVSGNANTFICNSLGFLTSQKVHYERLLIKNMFIHIPWTDDYKDKVVLEPNKIFIKKEEFYEAVEKLIYYI